MGPNIGNGMGGMELGVMHPNGGNHPSATEYTLQGVMRFLQSEWHKHERDRNAWEIEKQEMKGRIANLEGQARRADATQKALRKYVSILEKKVRTQAVMLKGEAAVEEEEAAKQDRAAQVEEKLKSLSDTYNIPGAEGIELEKPDDERQRQELKTFLDQAQSEFLYLMVTPANPHPPRDSPPLPLMDELRDVDYGMPGSQHMERQYNLPQRPYPNHMTDMNTRQHILPSQGPLTHPPPPANFAQKSEVQSQPMIRSMNEQGQQRLNENNWSAAPPVSVSTAAIDESMGPREAAEALGSMGQAPDVRLNQQAPNSTEAEGWDFPEGTFPEPGTAQSAVANATNRPDTDVFPTADSLPKSPNRAASHRRKGSMSRRRSAEHDLALAKEQTDAGSFKLRFGLRGHLETVRTVIFSGGGSPGEPEICTAGDDGMIKRFNIPRLDSYSSTSNAASDFNVVANFTHRGHSGSVLALTSWSPSPNFSTGGRAIGDGWIFSGGQDATVRVWERGRVDPKATLEGHTDAVWTLCVLPATLGSVFGNSTQYGSSDRILLVSGAADGTVRLWAVSAPPQLSSPQPGPNRPASGRGGRVRGNSMSSGSGFSNSPQPSMASNSPCSHTLVHTISRADGSSATPTCISPLGPSGETFVVSYTDSAVVVYDTSTGEQVGSMDSTDTYDGSIRTGVNSVVATTIGLDQGQHHGSMGDEDSSPTGGPTGGRSMAGSGVEGTIISGHEDRFVRFYDANSGQCTYNMLAHPDSISSLSLSPDGRELVSAGHDGSLRFWSLETRSCTQEMTSHRVMRGEGTCSCVWSQDGKWVVSGGGDGMIKVFAR